MSTREALPKVSVVMPCYNAAPYVEEAMASVLAQEGVAVELVVVDDASSDGSAGVVRAFAARHPDRVRVLALEANRGGCHARNRGAEAASGELLTFLDADDRIAPGTLAALARAAKAAPGALAFCGWARLKEEGGAWVTAPADAPLPAPGADPLAEWLLERWVPTCSLMWPRDVYGRTGGWDESLSVNQDGDLAMRALAAGAPLVRAEGGEGHYRTHGVTRASVSQSLAGERKLRSKMRVLEKLETVLDEQGRLAEYAGPLGTAWQAAGLLGFQQGHAELARECLARGERLAGGRAAVSRTGLGRLLVRVIGIERKERLVQALARHGIMTPGRRASARLRALGADARGAAAGAEAAR